MGASVLIIDAEEDFASLQADALRSQGCDVIITPDGKAGLDSARINIPNAIVLCVELPRMSGYSICAKLKKDPTLRAVPLVITSAEATQETFEHHKKLKTRAEEYLKKPFDSAALIEVLRRHVSFDTGSVEVQEDLAIDAEVPVTLSDDEAFGSESPFPSVSSSTPAEAFDLGGSVGLLDDAELDDLDDEARTMVGTMPIMAQVGGLEARIRDLTEQVEQAQAAQQEAERARDEALVRATASSLPSQLPTGAAAGREALSLKKELSKKEHEILELRDELQQKGKDLLAAKDEQMELEGRLLQLQEDREVSERDKAAYEARATAAEEALRTHTEESANKLKELEDQLSEASLRGLTLQETVSQEQERANGLQQTLDAKAAEAEAAVSQLAERDAEVENLAGQTRVLGAEVTRLTNEMNAAVAESDGLRGQLATAQSRIEELEQNAAALSTELEGAVAGLADTRAETAALQQQLDEADRRVQHDQEIRAKAQQALQIAAALLLEGPPPVGVAEDDESFDIEPPELDGASA